MYLMDLFQHWKGLQVAVLYGRTVTHGKHSIGYLGPPFWGKLTKKERTITSVTKFKVMIQKNDLLAGVDRCKTNCYICTA